MRTCDSFDEWHGNQELLLERTWCENPRAFSLPSTRVGDSKPRQTTNPVRGQLNENESLFHLIKLKQSLLFLVLSKELMFRFI